MPRQVIPRHIGDNWKADLNGHGKINVLDLLVVHNNLNTRCEPVELIGRTTGPNLLQNPGFEDITSNLPAIWQCEGQNRYYSSDRTTSRTGAAPSRTARSSSITTRRRLPSTASRKAPAAAAVSARRTSPASRTSAATSSDTPGDWCYPCRRGGRGRRHTAGWPPPADCRCHSSRDAASGVTTAAPAWQSRG